MSKKVCMLTTEHSALDDRIFYKESQSLHKAGYDVTLIAPLDQDGFLTDMGRKPIALSETNIDGINIVGFKIGRHSLFGLPKTWTLSQWFRLSMDAKSDFEKHDPFADMINKGIKFDADVYHCHEIWSLYAGIKIKHELEKRGKKVKLICDVHEYWPAKQYGNKIRENIWSRAKNRFEKKNYKYVDYFFTVNQMLRGYLLLINGFRNTEVLYNCSLSSIFGESEQKIVNLQKTITICHEGSLVFSRGLKEIIEVMSSLKERYKGRVCLLIIGEAYGKEKEYLDENIKKYEIEDIVKFTGWLPYEEVGNAISNGAIGINFLDYHFENNMFTTAIKLFNYMRYGLPIVTVDLPETRRIILDANCGVIVKERTTEALADALSMLIDQPELRKKLGQNSRRAFEEKYNWGAMEKRLLRVYEELLSSSNLVL